MAIGSRAYFNSYVNIFEFVLVVGGGLAELTLAFRNSLQIYFVVVLVRSVRLLRIFRVMPRYSTYHSIPYHSQLRY